MVKRKIDTLNDTGFLIACEIVPYLCRGKTVELIANCMVDGYMPTEAIIFLPEILAKIECGIDFHMSSKDITADGSSKDGDEQIRYRIKLKPGCKAIA